MDDSSAIHQVLVDYQAALNAGSTAQVMPLYMSDGVFMPPYSRSAVGKTEVERAYDAVFRALSFDVEFEILEINQMDPDWAFGRTSSSGATVDRSTGTRHAEANQELFIFKKDSDLTWRIARYSFSSTNPRMSPTS